MWSEEEDENTVQNINTVIIKKKKCEEEDFKSGNGEEECVCRFFIVDMYSYGGFGFKRS